MWDRLSHMNMGLLYEYEYRTASVVHVHWNSIDAMQYWTIPYAYGKVPYAYERSLSYTYAYVGPYILATLMHLAARPVARNSTIPGSQLPQKVHTDF